MQRSKLIVKAGAAGVLTCGLVFTAMSLLGDRAPPPALGPAIVVQVASPATRPSFQPSKDPAVVKACRDVIVERARATANPGPAPAAADADWRAGR